MKIRESKEIKASVVTIWDILRDPGNMPAWNHKCQKTDGHNGVVVGSTFSAEFILGGETKSTSCQIVDLEPLEKIAIKYSGEAFSRKGGYVTETFFLMHQGNNMTKVILEINFTHSKLPIFVMLVMRAVNAFGYKAGKSSLDGLATLVKAKVNCLPNRI